MMTQTLALLIDAYRELNSKKLFWITLMLSGLVVLAFAGIGVNKYGMTVLFWDIPIPAVNSTTIPPETFYKLAFVKFGIGFWLAWIATILALVSTSPIFPDFLAGGAIELVLSKPIRRMRLFLTKYFVGLLFVTLQVSVFTAACFLVIGLRGHAWDWRLFLAIPIVVCFFSYLFSVCTLLGVVTRSTIASLLFTLLIWFFIFLLHTADAVTLTFREQTAMQTSMISKRIQRMETSTSGTLDKQRLAPKTDPADPESVVAPDAAPAEPAKHQPYTPEELDAANPILAEARRKREDLEGTTKTLTKWNNLFVASKTALPKTTETIEVLKRAVLTGEEMKRFQVDDIEEQNTEPRRNRRGEVVEDRVNQGALAQQVESLIDKRSLWWVLGTSLGFEGVMIIIAGWIFCRRDF